MRMVVRELSNMQYCQSPVSMSQPVTTINAREASVSENGHKFFMVMTHDYGVEINKLAKIGRCDDSPHIDGKSENVTDSPNNPWG